MRILPAILCLASPILCGAATLPTMTPAQALSEARVAALPSAQQAPWRDYLARSRQLMAADKAALQAEGPPDATPRPHGGPQDGGMPLREPAAWYGKPEALHIASNILSFQTPAGAWGKNVDRSGPPRRRGEPWAPPEAGQHKASWSYVGTFDNGATTSELRFLARVQAQLPGAQGEPCRAAFLKGLRYILDAQYPNGGFPQVYPLQGGYHDAVTLNDNAMVRVATLLADVMDGQGDFAFVPAAQLKKARAAVERAVVMFLATQQRSGAVSSGWGQQYDVLTLALAGARKFEPAALASFETAAVLDFLMRLPDPSPQVRAAVDGGVAWLRAVALRDAAWKATPDGRRLVPDPGAPELWARYYDARTMRPVFGDRDGAIHDDVDELQAERRNGYAWFGSAPARTIARYAAWSGQAKLARLIQVGDSAMAPNGGHGDAPSRRLQPNVPKELQDAGPAPSSGSPAPAQAAGVKPRVIVSTDIGGTDFDDFQSLVHLLLYADTVELEGLTASPWGEGRGRKRHLLAIIDAYGKDYPSLTTWSPAYPTPASLRGIAVRSGRARGQALSSPITEAAPSRTSPP